MATIRTHYDNLKVSRDAPPEVIRAAYRTLSQKYHPDRNTSPDAERVMRLLNQAYAVLSDPHRRTEHDEWIDAQSQVVDEQPTPEQDGFERNADPTDRPSSRDRAGAILFPAGGRSPFDQLPPDVAAGLRERLRGQRSDQVLLPMASGPLASLIKTLIPLAFIAAVAVSATESRWQSDTGELLAWIAAAAGLYFGSQARYLVNSIRSPLSPALIATPIYLIETSWNEVVYWPIPLIRISKATNHLRNGRYTHTSFDLEAGQKTRQFSFDSEDGYSRFVAVLSSGLRRYVEASEQRTARLFQGLDELSGRELVSPTKPLTESLSRFLWWIAGATIFVLTIGLLHQHNLTLPAPPPARGSHYSAPTSDASQHSQAPEQQEETAPAVRTDQIAQRIGTSRIPSSAAYIPGEPLRRMGGLFSVTVDNSGTGQDVLVKLVEINGVNASPIRTFFIPAGDSFTAKNIRPGNYEVRYVARHQPGASKSEEFSLEEVDTRTGTEYSQVSLTLYAIQGGNMRMQSIPDDQF